jgi:CheY-like chemotaxis protein
MPNELILIVEDNPKNLKLVRNTLQVKGYQTIEAETGEEGVQLARERPSKEKPGQVPPSLRSALLLPESIACRVDAHHDSTRIEELRLWGELAADGARLVQQ